MCYFRLLYLGIAQHLESYMRIGMKNGASIQAATKKLEWCMIYVTPFVTTDRNTDNLDPTLLLVSATKCK